MLLSMRRMFTRMPRVSENVAESMLGVTAF